MVVPRRTLVLAVGATLALAAALALAVAFGGRHEPPVATLDPATPAPARRLTLEVSRDTRSDDGKRMRCFVDGRFVGVETVSACAAKNGVDPKPLDVGLGGSGEPAAGEPAPPQVSRPAAAQDADPAPTRAVAPASPAPEADDRSRSGPPDAGAAPPPGVDRPR